jgi:hypothetical protein
MIFTILVSCTLFTMRYWNENQCVKDLNCIQLKGEDWYCDLSARTPGTCQQMDEYVVDTANTDSGDTTVEGACTFNFTDLNFPEDVGNTTYDIERIGNCPDGIELNYSTHSPLELDPLTVVSEQIVSDTVQLFEKYQHFLARDLDADGDLDLVAAAGVSQQHSQVVWYENEGRQNFTMHVLSSDIDYLYGLEVVDINQDGDLDIVITHNIAVDIFDNDGQTDPTFTINKTLSAPLCQQSAVGDVDMDGDIDIVCGGSSPDNDMFWYKNEGGADPTFTFIAIGTHQYEVIDLKLADINTDGLLDIVTASSMGQNIQIYLYDGNSPPTFGKSLIDLSGLGTLASDVPMMTDIADINGDGDLDLLSTSENTINYNTMVWYENNEELVTSFTQHVVPSMYLASNAIDGGDMDGDGDLDILSNVNGDIGFSWHEHTQMNVYNAHQIWSPDDASLIDSFIDKELGDIDDDGDLDILLLMKGEPSLRIIENNVQDHKQNIVATENYDFQNSAGTAIFTAGQSTAQVSLKISDDTEQENDEYYYMDFFYDDGTLVHRQKITISDND